MTDLSLLMFREEMRYGVPGEPVDPYDDVGDDVAADD